MDGISGLLESRAKLLPLAAQLAGLPERALASLEHPKSNYLVGWSRGKEILANGEPDVNKGSFYANPLVDERPTSPDTESAAERTLPSVYLYHFFVHVLALVLVYLCANDVQQHCPVPHGSRTYVKQGYVKQRIHNAVSTCIDTAIQIQGSTLVMATKYREI